MIVKKGPFGEFMGCSKFPVCRSKQKVLRNQDEINKSVMAFANDGNELDPEKFIQLNSSLSIIIFAQWHH